MVSHGLVLGRASEPRAVRRQDTLKANAVVSLEAREPWACVWRPIHVHALTVGIIALFALVSSHWDGIHDAWYIDRASQNVVLRDSLTALVINGNSSLSAATTQAGRSILTVEAAMLGSLAPVALVLALRVSTISEADAVLRSQ